MRTTLDIEDGVLAAARALAQDTGLSLGAAVSVLARRGLAATERPTGGGFPIFASDRDAPAITLDLVNEHRDVR